MKLKLDILHGSKLGMILGFLTAIFQRTQGTNQRSNQPAQQKLGGGFEYFYFHLYLGKVSNWTNIFQMG